MNALQKDLMKLTALAEQAGAALPADPQRLRFHLMPPVGWLNDPNGLCKFREEYHVFYQYAPFDPAGGIKFWGHYKSRDLLRWEQCPVMLYSDQPFDVHGAYSGSALCEEDGLYLYYTGNIKYDGGHDYIHTGRGHNTVLAYSPDGVTLGWKRLLLGNDDYPEGLTCHIRDPKVWKQDGKYYMVQGARTSEDVGEVLVFESDDRLEWRHINTLTAETPFGYMWECPDLFELDGHWFLVVSPQGAERSGPGFENAYACGYFPVEGDFRGACTLGEFVPLDYGFDFYAPQSFLDGGRRLVIGWQGMPDADYTNPTAAHGWQHCLTIPRELRYEGGKLVQQPVKELEGLRTGGQAFPVDGGGEWELPEAAEIVMDCAGVREVEISGAVLRMGADGLGLAIEKGGFGRIVRHTPVKTLETLRIFVDTTAIEVFVNGGEAVLSTRWYPDGEGRRLRVQGSGNVTIYPLRALEIVR